MFSKENLIFANAKRRIPIVQYDANWNIVNEYESVAKAAKENNLSDSHISQCCNGKRKSCCGYKWKRKMEENSNE
jgi:hypothetical protein